MSTIITVAGSGTAPQVDLTFTYLDQAYVKASVGGVNRTFTWVNATRIQMDAAVAGGSDLLVYRETPIDIDLVAFSDGSVLTAAELNLADQQLRHHQQEINSRIAASSEAATTADLDAAIALAAANAALADADRIAAAASAAASAASAVTASDAAAAAVAVNKANVAGGNAFTGAQSFASDITVPDESYGVAWDGSLEAPTKNAVYDKVETLIASGGGLVTEDVRDIIGSTLVDGGDGISIAVNDVGDTVTITNDLATGAAKGAMSAADFTKLAGITAGATAYAAENARDDVGAALVGGRNIDVTLDDGGNTITVSSSGIDMGTATAGKTLVLTDAGTTVPTTGNIIIPANASVAYPVGTVIEVYNNSAVAVTIAITTDTLRLVGTATVGTRTLAQRGLALLKKVAATEWLAGGVT